MFQEISYYDQRTQPTNGPNQLTENLSRIEMRGRISRSRQPNASPRRRASRAVAPSLLPGNTIMFLLPLTEARDTEAMSAIFITCPSFSLKRAFFMFLC